MDPSRAVEADLLQPEEERVDRPLRPIPSSGLPVTVWGHHEPALDPTHYYRPQVRCPTHPLAPSCRRQLMGAVAALPLRADQTSWQI